MTITSRRRVRSTWSYDSAAVKKCPRIIRHVLSICPTLGHPVARVLSWSIGNTGKGGEVSGDQTDDYECQYDVGQEKILLYYK